MTPEPPRWHKSSHSNNGGNCVEVATNPASTHGLIPVRDSKLHDGPVLSFPAVAFSTFMKHIKSVASGSA